MRCRFKQLCLLACLPVCAALSYSFNLLTDEKERRQAEEFLAHASQNHSYGSTALKVSAADVSVATAVGAAAVICIEIILTKLGSRLHQLFQSQLVAADGAPVEVRQAAALHFKNFVKKRWQGSMAGDIGGADIPPLPDSEKVWT